MLALKVVLLLLPTVDGNYTCFFIKIDLSNGQFLSDILITMFMHFSLISSSMCIKVISSQISPPSMPSQRNLVLKNVWDLEQLLSCVSTLGLDWGGKPPLWAFVRPPTVATIPRTRGPVEGPFLSRNGASVHVSSLWHSLRGASGALSLGGGRQVYLWRYGRNLD